MGEAKRRKQAGTYPEPDDPLEAVRRFWCGRSAGPAEEFRAPVGTVAVTLDVQGAAPSILHDRRSEAGGCDERDRAVHHDTGLLPHRALRRVAVLRRSKVATIWHSSGSAWSACGRHCIIRNSGLPCVTRFLRRWAATGRRTSHGSSRRPRFLAMVMAEGFVDLEGIRGTCTEGSCDGLPRSASGR